MNSYGIRPFYSLVRWDSKRKAWRTIPNNLDNLEHYYTDNQSCLYFRAYTGDPQNYIDPTHGFEYSDQYWTNQVVFITTPNDTGTATSEQNAAAMDQCPAHTHMVEQPSPVTCTPATQNSIAVCTNDAVFQFSCEPDSVSNIVVAPSTQANGPVTAVMPATVPAVTTDQGINSTTNIFHSNSLPNTSIKSDELTPGREYVLCVSTTDGHDLVIHACSLDPKPVE